VTEPMVWGFAGFALGTTLGVFLGVWWGAK
jgi:hypothetical protein